jgi:hypothetical protein
MKLTDLLTGQTKLMLRADTLNHKDILYDEIDVLEPVLVLHLGFD